MRDVTIGIIGCGNISAAYLRGAAASRLVRVKSVADLRPEASQARAAEFAVEATSIDRLLADPEIEVVLNLTVPQAHVPVGLDVLSAGKHLYAEKPLGTTVAGGRQLLAKAEAAGLRIGCAPDTFMGGGHQACRRAIDTGLIGTPVAGHAAIQTRGMEHWHPDPTFFFKPGGGPVLDMGPYYVTQLVNMLGPVKSVMAQGSSGYAARVIGSGAKAGQEITVEVPTTVNAILLFESGANITLSHSWDVWAHRRLPFEIYGTEGSLLVPDPNYFGGTPEFTRRNGAWEPLDITAQPFGANNMQHPLTGIALANYRIIGLLDMAAGIALGRPHRASGTLALHVLEVLEAIGLAAVEQRAVMIESRCDRPTPVPQGQDETVLWQ
ncbi:Gfo/Idh/MocA family oxidoreductase [Roseomonas sp. GC11]|uniref:Gfo/Idh/MocA family protein n=1 Tax=Roseomonas sp. GC11 TaxID=2950546 RepID=UPI00210DDF67|nr:Gfo/Idh/MocA family oxidoreductase [Roseomonas sp. GC11]MCQ4162781.1 Gfo/Idh/MocA family oxidoreductase [Roseomonas sp. GC11]